MLVLAPPPHLLAKLKAYKGLGCISVPVYGVVFTFLSPGTTVEVLTVQTTLIKQALIYLTFIPDSSIVGPKRERGEVFKKAFERYGEEKV